MDLFVNDADSEVQDIELERDKNTTPRRGNQTARHRTGGPPARMPRSRTRPVAHTSHTDTMNDDDFALEEDY